MLSACIYVSVYDLCAAHSTDLASHSRQWGSPGYPAARAHAHPWGLCNPCSPQLHVPLCLCHVCKSSKCAKHTCMCVWDGVSSSPLRSPPSPLPPPPLHVPIPLCRLTLPVKVISEEAQAAQQAGAPHRALWWQQRRSLVCSLRDSRHRTHTGQCQLRKHGTPEQPVQQ